MIYLTVLIGIVLVCVLTAPFFVGAGGLLQASASINSKEKLAALKEAVAQRFIEDEKAFKDGQLSSLAWEKRKAFLTNRYIDASRRLDFLSGVKPAAGAKSEGENGGAA